MTTRVTGALPGGSYDALTATGTAVELRPFTAGDEPALHEFLAGVSDDSSYRRFFTASRAAGDDYIDHLGDGRRTVAAVVVLDREVIAGVGSLHAADASSGPLEAEVALLVDDRHQGQGLGTLILEDLLARALVLGVDSVVAVVQPANHGMLDVFAHSGFAVRQEFEDGEVADGWPSVRRTPKPPRSTTSCAPRRWPSSGPGSTPPLSAGRCWVT
jgi:RimJ/RimL family protein N-acetyltransferase